MTQINNLPSLQIRNYRMKFRIFCSLTIILVALLIGIVLFGVLYIFGYIPSIFTGGLPTIVSTKCGQIQGQINSGIVEFIGIPYAMPPIDSNRFSHAKEVVSEAECRLIFGDVNSIFKAQKYGSQCLQQDRYSNKLEGNENCLFLNVYVPPIRFTDKLPIIFIINGLFFTFGSGNMSGWRVTPEVVLETKSIHVTLNYRLGPMGSLVNPITNETNFGLSDILVALKWINQNIANFGGNPANVVLYGVGSGSTMALALYNSNYAANLFNKLWLSSPGLKIQSSLNDVLTYQKHSNISVGNDNNNNNNNNQNLLNIEQIFRHYNWINVTDEFQRNWFDFPGKSSSSPTLKKKLFFIIIDNYFLKSQDVLLLKNLPKHRNIPLVIGNNANDVDILPYPNTMKLWNREFLQLYLLQSISKMNTSKAASDLLKDLEKMYVYKPKEEVGNLFTLALTDLRCTCPINYHLKSLLSSELTQPIYRYILTDNHRNFDAYSIQHTTTTAHYTWDSILYFQGYKYFDNYGSTFENELKMSKLLHRLMFKFAHHKTIDELQISSGSYIRMNYIRDGLIDKACFMKYNECNFWHSIFTDIDTNQWVI